MRKRISTVIFVVFLVLLVLGFAFEKSIRGYFEGFNSFVLTNIQLETMVGQKTRIPEGFRGNVVFYSDVKGCTACMSKLASIRQVLESYEDINFYSILRGEKQRERFNSVMSKYDIPGQYLVDPRAVIGNRLSLSTHPALMFFNREGRIVATLPLDIPHDKLAKQYYRYIDEL